jgi:predicted phosphoribosyltransferase
MVYTIYKNRTDAGKSLSLALIKYTSSHTIILTLPRGGVVVACEVAQALNAPLSLVIAQKIGHPLSPEYAIAAINKDGLCIENEIEIHNVSHSWFEKEKKLKQKEAQRRYVKYLLGRKRMCLKNKNVIIIDDGIATGLTMQCAIEEVRREKPKTIIVAAPVISSHTAQKMRQLVDEVIALQEPISFSAVGQYYEEFFQVTDDEVINILRNFM